MEGNYFPQDHTTSDKLEQSHILPQIGTQQWDTVQSTFPVHWKTGREILTIIATLETAKPVPYPYACHHMDNNHNRNCILAT